MRPIPPPRFNEAAGFTQRKPSWKTNGSAMANTASMRPPVLPSGNVNVLPSIKLISLFCFNEAAGFTQRKLSYLYLVVELITYRFNEAAGFTQRKPQLDGDEVPADEALQ